MIVDVPDDIVAAAADEEFLPISQGVVDFTEGAGLETLCRAWPKLEKRIIPLNCP